MAEGQKETEAEKESQPVRVEGKDSAGEAGAKTDDDAGSSSDEDDGGKKVVDADAESKKGIERAKLKKKDHCTK